MSEGLWVDKDGNLRYTTQSRKLYFMQPDLEAYCQRYNEFRQIYHKEFRPPEWVSNECESILRTYGSSAVVLYVDGDPLETVKRLAYEREPVNIEMQRAYYKAKLKDKFGYEYGAYSELSEAGQPPQIAISCTTPVQNPDGANRVDVAVVNLIGLAFDDQQQPDYQRLVKDGILDEAAKGLVLKFMTQAYALAFKATSQSGREVLCASPIGNVSFKPPGYTTFQFEREFVYPAISAANLMFPEIEVEHPIFGFDTDGFRVPQCFFNGGIWSQNLEQRMFVNAWDCWSALGNGNSMDESADGYWGRSSAISLLGWPGANPLISYVSMESAS